MLLLIVKPSLQCATEIINLIDWLITINRSQHLPQTIHGRDDNGLDVSHVDNFRLVATVVGRKGPAGKWKISHSVSSLATQWRRLNAQKITEGRRQDLCWQWFVRQETGDVWHTQQSVIQSVSQTVWVQFECDKRRPYCGVAWSLTVAAHCIAGLPTDVRSIHYRVNTVHLTCLYVAVWRPGTSSIFVIG